MTETPGTATADMVRLFEEAAGRLEARGWARETYGPPDGPNCLLGALTWAEVDLGYRVADDDNPHQTSAKPAFLRFLMEAEVALARALNSGCSVFDVLEWNDEECQDGAQAAEALRQAAKNLQ